MNTCFKMGYYYTKLFSTYLYALHNKPILHLKPICTTTGQSHMFIHQSLKSVQK